ncbi:ankyrin repeat protein, putative [Trichomonas vaginalis G3]|uniref:Ankyrin repeat protein, putative n=1 Tax=Trichomonas vaginalis (strain ATCC PRA-98 / G3) TaxID=412133 RepID=A2EA79_TRIV3|nr:protein ubiquitination [Trichomonas vaginalis G3]EAY10419.1 ankyrin repeat protein, putative [Trichomonas vaginalis G3]KAI5548326.1 protein ubiquitination [Trichomonas vaginalis G3]|eukprot:XP_001322642.1 ankyrin repeat protein [Trichomonas vaginalis G3]
MSYEHANDMNQIANNVHSFIEDGIFYDVVDKSISQQAIEKAKIDSISYNELLSLEKSKRKSAKVTVNSFDDVLEILHFYKKFLKLESSQSLIEFLEKYKSNGTKDNEIKQLKSDISTLQNTNEQLIRASNDFTTIFSLKNSNNFDAAYSFLKTISDNKDKMMIRKSCLLGLSEIRDGNENTPLIAACINGDYQLTKSLIEGGCNRKCTNDREGNCLFEASLAGHLEIVRYLISVGFDKNWRKKTRRSTAILAASSNRHLKVVKYLISIGCDANSSNFRNLNCIYFASLNGHLETVKYLISMGGNPAQITHDGCSPLMIAVIRGHFAIVKYLISFGLDLHVKNIYGESPIILASKNGHLNIVK